MLQGIASVLLLLSYGADVNAMADSRHDYRTVLHYAILGGDPAVINLLLKQGARLDLGPDYQKPTALDLAILKGDPSIVEMLLQAGELRYRIRLSRDIVLLAYGRIAWHSKDIACRISARGCLNRYNKFDLKFSQILFNVRIIQATIILPKGLNICL